MKITLYVACHKKYENPFGHMSLFLKFLKCIEVGSSIHEESICELRDNTGDSISHKNNSYNELTAQYWIWKNDNNSEIVGLCHYRRYFKNPRISEKAPNYIKLLKPREIQRVLKNYDYIGIKTGPFETSCRERINTPISGLRAKDIPLVKQILLEKSGQLYADSFDIVMNRNWNHLYNMFIAPKNRFDSYSEWLFPVLEEIENRIDEKELFGQEKRIIGLWSEYLFNVYVVANNYKVYNCDFIYFDI